jgi:FkbM family methyltransferase
VSQIHAGSRAMLRLAVRDAFSHVLGWIPLSLIQDLRMTDGVTSEGHFWDSLRSVVLQLLRYRPIDASIEFFRLSENPPLFLANDNSSFSRRLFWEGKAQQGGLNLWMNLCAQATGILEIGANVGYYTIFGASVARMTPYMVVEPHPTSLMYLRQNLQLNHIQHVEVLQAAAVGKKASPKLQWLVPKADPDSTPAGAYLAGGEAVAPGSIRDALSVDAVEALTLIRATTNLIKLDVEGYEFEILNSMLPLVFERQPTIFVEVRRRTHSLRQLIRRLAIEARYSIYAIGKEALHPVSPDEILHVVLQDVYNTRDVLLSPLRGAEDPDENVNSRFQYRTH